MFISLAKLRTLSASDCGLSVVRPTICTPLPAYSLLRSTRCGISMRQGPHQVAQRSRTTTLSLKSERWNDPPSTSCISVFQTSGGTVSSLAGGGGWGGCGGCGPRFAVTVTFGWLGCAALLLAVRLAVSFDTQLEMTSAERVKTKAVSESRPVVQKRFLSCACFMSDVAF